MIILTLLVTKTKELIAIWKKENTTVGNELNFEGFGSSIEDA